MKRTLMVMGVISMLLVGGYSSDGVQSAQAAQVNSCKEPLQPYIRASLYMDRSDPKAPSRRISDEEWQGFVDDVLLRHFPAGGTIYANSGWWRRPDGTTGGGKGQTLVILAPASEGDSQAKAVKAVISEVKKRYSHRSVLWEQDQVCAMF